MKNLKISGLFIYPVKSLPGISTDTAELVETGFKNDRKWMIIDENNTFISQRKHPELALLHVNLTDEGFNISDRAGKVGALFLPFNAAGNKLEAVIWDDKVKAVDCGNLPDQWFSEYLKQRVKLVYMPAETERHVDSRFAKNKEITSFTDGFPLLIIGLSSLDDLNRRLKQKVTINRFRPNIVFSGGEPYEEDNWHEFRIGGLNFMVVKPCARCTITTVDPDTGFKGKEPLATLASYRSVENKVMFGQNVIHSDRGFVSTGDCITIVSAGN